MLLLCALSGGCAAPAAVERAAALRAEEAQSSPEAGWLRWQLVRRGVVGLVVAGAFAGLILRSRARAARPPGRA